MVKCSDCGQEMKDKKTQSCTFTRIEIDGKVYKRNTHYHDEGKRCHDCMVVNKEVHHYGCDMERCPKCGDQLISCNCSVNAVMWDKDAS